MELKDYRNAVLSPQRYDPRIRSMELKESKLPFFPSLESENPFNGIESSNRPKKQ